MWPLDANGYDRPTMTLAPRYRVVLISVFLVLGVWIFSEHYFFFFRDNFSTHYPVKSLTGQILEAGELPLWDPFSGGGQPLAGNPNYLTFYPTTLLFVLLPDHIAFTAHFVIHLLLGGLGIFLLLRLYGVEKVLAGIGGMTYLLSGPVLSTTSFYNMVVVAGLSPWIILHLERVLRSASRFSVRDALRLGGTMGLVGLTGEAVTVGALGLCMLAIVLTSEGWTRRGRELLLSLLIAIAIALPMLAAWEEIHEMTERSVFPTSAKETLLASLPPHRLAELVFGPAKGTIVSNPDAGGPQAVLLSSVLVGLLLIPALIAPTRQKGLLVWKGLMIVLPLVALGSYNPAVRWVVDLFGGFPVRYPQKLMLAAAMVGVILIFRFLDQIDSRANRKLLIVSLALLAAGALICWSSQGPVDPKWIVSVGLQLCAISILVWPRIERRASLAALLALGSLLIWIPETAPVDDADFWSERPLVADLIGSGAIVSRGGAEESGMNSVDRYRRSLERLDGMSGVRFGVSYPLTRSPEGMFSYLSRIEAERYATQPSVRDRYEAIAGITHLISSGETTIGGGNDQRMTIPMAIERLNRLPGYRSPEEAILVDGIDGAIETIEAADFDPARSAVIHSREVVSGNVEIVVRRVGSQSNEIVVDSSGKGVVITPLTWFPSWAVRSGGRELETFVAYLDQLAFIVPPGSSLVTIEFGRRRALIALLWIFSTALIVGSLGWNVSGGWVGE